MNKYKTEEITIRECELLNEMKDNCLNGGQYIDNNAKEKFKMLCHLEDFSIQYYNLIEVIDKALEILKQCNVDMDSLMLCENIDHAIYELKGEDNNEQRRK